MDEEASVLDSQGSSIIHFSTRCPGEASGEEVSSLSERIDVTFIHRTAIDFMKTQDVGAAFLRINTAFGFDARVFYVKVLLAKLRLFGYKADGLNRTIYRIMDAIWRAEHGTDSEPTTLCQMTDSIMWKIDQKYYNPKRSKEGHWSRRWGPSRLLYHINDMRELNPSKDPHDPSFQPMYFSGPNTQARPKWDFLLLAASYGLHRYVEKSLYNQGLMCDRDVAAYLLYGCILALSHILYYPERTVASLDFANKILKQDINLNYKVNGKFTLWSMFLWKMHEVLRFDHYHVGRETTTDAHVAHLQDMFMKTTLGFIGRGADLATQEVLKARVFIGDYDQHMSYVYWLDLSVLALLESCLMGQKELFRIREACKSAGACFNARCSMLKIRELGGRTSEQIELSDLESSAFLHLYNRDFTKEKIWGPTVQEMMQLSWRIQKERRNRVQTDDYTTSEAKAE